MRTRATTALLLSALCTIWSLVGAGPASADGDPASDILYGESVFVPVDAGIASALQLQLTALVREADRHGYQIKVALIAASADLGSDTPLWPHPVLYARFLGTELSLVYHGRLLIVMPNGLAIYQLRHSVRPEEQLLEQIAPVPGGQGLVIGAMTAIQRLAAADGHPLALPRKIVDSDTGGPTPILPLVVSVVGGLLIVLAWAASLWAAPPGLCRRARRRLGIAER